MKAIWPLVAQRINALSTRERVILFFSVLAGLLALVDTLWLTPAQNAQRALAQKFASQTEELNRLRVDLVLAGGMKSSNQRVREDIAAAHQRVDDINAQIKQFVPVTSGGPALEYVLVEFLRKQNGLTLISTATLKDESMTSLGAGSAPLASNGLMRRGLALRVSGPYAELARYVQTLEKALPNLRWGEMRLKVEKQVPELTLTVYVLGVHS